MGNLHKKIFVLLTKRAFDMANSTEAKYLLMRFTPSNVGTSGTEVIITGFYTAQPIDEKLSYSPQDMLIDLTKIRDDIDKYNIRTSKDYIRFLEGKYDGAPKGVIS